MATDKQLDKAKQRLQAELDATNGVDGHGVPKGASACEICGVRVRLGGFVSTESTWTEGREVSGDPAKVVYPWPPGNDWRQTGKGTFKRVWRLCDDHAWTHDLFQNDPEAGNLPLAAVLIACGRSYPWTPDELEDAKTVVKELGSFAYRDAGHPYDKGGKQPWAHAGDLVQTATMRMAGLEQQRRFAEEHGVRSTSGLPCAVCGCTHARQWGSAPLNMWGPPNRPELAVCATCVVPMDARHEDTRGQIQTSLADWAAAQVAGVADRPGLAEGVGFILAVNHPEFHTDELRKPWQYLGDDDREALRAYLAAPERRSDGRLSIPARAAS